MNYLLSVIIPTYRRTASLARLINLLKSQSISKNLEILVIDQNPHNYLEQQIGFSTLDGVNLVRLDQPNVSLARNTGAEAAQATHILFMDDDLLPPGDFCEKALAVLERYPFIKVLTPTLLRQGQAINEVLRDRIKDEVHQLSLGDKGFHASFFTISAATIFEKTTFFDSGGFDPYLFHFAKTAEDQEFFIRLIRQNIPVHLSTTLSTLIDESAPGGCDLRTVDYWTTRQKCMNAWSYRHRIHNKNFGKLSMRDLLELCRSAFLNREMVSFNLRTTGRQIKTLIHAIEESRRYVQKILQEGKLDRRLNHIHPGIIQSLTSLSLSDERKQNVTTSNC